MAVATYTSTTFINNQPINVHNANVSISGQLAWTAAHTVADVGFLCKIPHGAVIVDFVEDHTTGATSCGISFGLAKGGPGGSATFSCFIAEGQQAVMNRRSVMGSQSVVVSCSADDPDRWGILAAKTVNGTTTTSLIINWSVTYRMYGPTA